MSKHIQVPKELVGFIIGRGGEGVKRIAKDAGSGCRIFALKDQPGTMEISAYTKKAILFAEVKIKETINKAPKTKSKPNRPNFKQPTNRFDNLEYRQEDHREDREGDKPQHLSIRINHTDNIKDRKQRKYQEWLQRQGKLPLADTRDRKESQPSFQHQETDFPGLGSSTTASLGSSTTASLNTSSSIWGGKQMTEIKSAPERPVKKVIKVEETPRDWYPKPTTYKKSTFLSDLDEPIVAWGDDISDWEDEDEECNENNFENEMDEWYKEPSHTNVTWA
jgi:hypothetical protein